MRSARVLRLQGCVLALACALALPALADDDEEWGFTIAPYAWLLAIDGKLGANGGTADVDMPFSDIWDNLDFTFMGALEAKRGRWLAGVDTQVSELGPKATFHIIGNQFGKAKTDVWMTVTKLQAGYRALSYPIFGEDDDRRITLDALVGARLWTLDTNVKLEIPILGDRRFHAYDWWVDPVLGTSIRTDLGHRFLLTVSGNIGGFDIGSASRFSWEALGMLGFGVTEHLALGAGYRAIGLDRKTGSDGFDGAMKGPFLGFAWSWGAGTR